MRNDEVDDEDGDECKGPCRYAKGSECKPGIGLVLLDGLAGEKKEHPHATHWSACAFESAEEGSPSS